MLQAWNRHSKIMKHDEENRREIEIQNLYDYEEWL